MLPSGLPSGGSSDRRPRRADAPADPAWGEDAQRRTARDTANAQRAGDLSEGQRLKSDGLPETESSETVGTPFRTRGIVRTAGRRGGRPPRRRPSAPAGLRALAA